MIDYTKQCWFCGKQSMKPEASFYRCTECGATYVEQPGDGDFTDVEPGKDFAAGYPTSSPVSRPRFPAPRPRWTKTP